MSLLFGMQATNNFAINTSEIKNGVLYSQSVARSSIWPMIAKLPVVHPYTDYLPPQSIIALECEVPISFKNQAQQAFFHIQILPEPEKIQNIRVHPYTHPQNMPFNQSHCIPVHAELKAISDLKTLLCANLSASVHPANGMLVASPNDGVFNLDWKKEQAFLGFYKFSQKKIMVLHITIPEKNWTIDFIQNLLPYNSLLEFLHYDNDKSAGLLSFIRESYYSIFKH